MRSATDAGHAERSEASILMSSFFRAHWNMMFMSGDFVAFMCVMYVSMSAPTTMNIMSIIIMEVSPAHMSSPVAMMIGVFGAFLF
jgi:hypothetical protein